MSGFHDVRLPMTLSLGTQGGPQWRTEIVTLASGQEVRNALWSRARRRWDIGGAIGDIASLQTVIAFFEARRGRLYGFRFRDPLDYSSALPGEPISRQDQWLGVGDGQTTCFQLIKDYGGTPRPIAKPVAGTVAIAINDSLQTQGWTLDRQTGTVEFATAPAAGARLSCGFEFDCAVRFENDTLTSVIEAFDAGRIVSLSLIELPWTM